MTLMTVVYILNAKIGFNIQLSTSYIVGAVITVILTAVFFMKAVRNRRENIEVDVQLVERSCVEIFYTAFLKQEKITNKYVEITLSYNKGDSFDGKRASC